MALKSVMTFEKNLWITMLALKFNGAHHATKRNLKWAMQCLVIISFTFTCSFFLVYSIIFHDVIENKYDEACKNGAMVVVAIVVNFKYVILVVNQKQISGLINIINSDYEKVERCTPEEEEIVKDYALRGIWVGKLWLVTAICTSSLFPLTAFIKMVYYYCTLGEIRLIPMFDMYYPSPINDNKDEPITFMCTFMLCFGFGVYAASMYTGFDPIGPSFMMHMCGQLELNKCRILELFSKNDEVPVIKQKLKDIIIDLQRVYSFVDMNQKCFTIIYEISMKTTSVVIPITAFQILESISKGFVNLEFVSLICGCFIHCYVPCYYSDMLMEKGDDLMNAIYACGWEVNKDKSLRITLLMMINRASRSLALKSVFTTLNLDSFAEMCKQSYTLFNLMNAAFK